MTNRVEAAISDGRCVLAVGGRALSNPEVQAELRRRNIATVALGSEVVNPAVPVSADALAPALVHEGGVLVLVEPEAGTDGRSLEAIAGLLKGGSHKPRLFVAAKAFNPFALPMGLRTLKFEQIKARGVDFLSSLSVQAPAVAAPAPAGQPRAEAGDKASRVPAPRPVFVGRAEELAALGAMLATDGGPIVVTGPPGVGRRWLVERALSLAGRKRLPDLVLGRAIGADTLLARIAMAGRIAGDDRLHEALCAPTRPVPVELARLAVEVLQDPRQSGVTWVIHGLHRLLDRRDGSLYHDGRQELVLKTMLTSPLAMRVVFVAECAPTFYREGQNAAMRVFPVAGLAGRDLFELFEAWQAPAFPRDRFGPIHDRLHGHPVAARYLAIAIREEGDPDPILEQPKFLRSTEVADLAAVRRHLKRRVDELDPEARAAIARLSLLREPASIELVQSMDVSRALRLRLLGLGLLEQTPFQDDRSYYVHELVTEQIPAREALDFDVMERLANLIHGRAREMKGPAERLEALALVQEGNRLLTEARKARSRVGLPYPDNDALVDNVRGILRQKSPRLDIAHMRAAEALRSDPTNPELLVVSAEAKAAEKGPIDAVAAIYAQAAEQAPTPEVFHAEASWHMNRNARGKAAAALERGIAAFPDNGRLHRRLAGIYLSSNRLMDAVDVLVKARDVEPMMPDTYGLLGETLFRIGTDRWPEARELLAEAQRLSPDDAQHLARNGELLRLEAMVEPQNREDKLREAEALLRRAIAADKGSPRVQVALASVLLDADGDVEQAGWLLKQAYKKGETGDVLLQRARVLVRQKAFEEALRLVDRAQKKDPDNVRAFEVRGEYWMRQGQVFHAFEVYKVACERTPPNSPYRVLFERMKAQLQVLIESGQAAEMMRQAAVERSEAPPMGAPSGPRRDAGTTTILRKRGGGAADAAVEPEEEEVADDESSADEESGDEESDDDTSSVASEE